MDESKVLLFIVEGQSDEAALAPALEQIISTKKVKFKVMRADITADYASTVVNIEERIKNKAVKTFLKENPQFTSNDICEIVHIVDIDGAFIPNGKVEQADVEQMQYGEDSFYTLPGGDEQGALHDRFIVDEDALLELLIELFYVEI